MTLDSLLMGVLFLSETPRGKLRGFTMELLKIKS